MLQLSGFRQILEMKISLDELTEIFCKRVEGEMLEVFHFVFMVSCCKQIDSIVYFIGRDGKHILKCILQEFLVVALPPIYSITYTFLHHIDTLNIRSVPVFCSSYDKKKNKNKKDTSYLRQKILLLLK